MTLTIDEQAIKLPPPVQAALEADAKAQGKPVADVLADKLAQLYPGASDAWTVTEMGLPHAVGRLRGFGLLAGTGLTTATLLAERRQEVEAE